MKTRTLYMHTLDGKPAEYQEWHGWGSIVFGGLCVNRVANSLEQIRAEQRMALVGRSKVEHAELKHSYGYIRVKVPASFPQTETPQP